MKKIYLFSFLSIISMNLYCQVHWTKHPDNPVMLPGASGEWNCLTVGPGTVMFYDNTYHMYFDGSDGLSIAIGYATSPDGITWTQDVNNPVLEVGALGEWDDYWISNGFVLKIDTLFHMWYTGASVNESDIYRIGHATSYDGIEWIKDADNPVKDIAEDLDTTCYCMHAPVMFDGNQYHMYYSSGKWSSSRMDICHATSQDGYKWTKDPQNPLLGGNTYYYATSVIYDGDKFIMWYGYGSAWQWRINMAFSDDASAWEEYGPTVLSAGPPGSWDARCITRAVVLFDSTESKYKTWYAGTDTKGYEKIGYAESDTRLPALWVKSNTLVDATDTVVAEIYKDGIIYIVPEGTSPVNDSITKYMLASVEATANTEVQIPLTDFSLGQYTVVAVSNQEFVSPNPFPFQVISTGIQEDTHAGIRIYPNPANDLLTVEMDKPGWGFIEITSLNGQLLYSTRMEGSTLQIDLSSFRKGVYFITVRSRNQVWTEKIIKL